MAYTQKKVAQAKQAQTLKADRLNALYADGKVAAPSGGTVGSAGGSLFVRGQGATAPSLVVHYPAAASVGATGNQTLTIAQLVTGIVEEDPEGAANWTLPTAELLVAGITDCKVGDCIDFAIINSASTGANEIVTMVLGTGGTAVGNLLVAAGNVTEDEENSGSAMFRIRITATGGADSTYTIYRLA
jgi:hypothetical protein